MLFGDGRAQCRFLRRRIGFACTGSRGGLLHLRFGFAQPPSGGVRGVLPSGTFGSRFRRPSGGLDRADGRADFAAAGCFRWLGAEGGQSARYVPGKMNGMPTGLSTRLCLKWTTTATAGAYQCPPFRTVVSIYGGSFAFRTAYGTAGYVRRGTDFVFLPERRASQVPSGSGRVGADVFGRGGRCSSLPVRQPRGLVG